ncbi:hypothetical protein [Verrucomicrobium sp. BvORR106]|uniref:hypothetical protein n=1 Tax=Verrucomicrobium sp. BvORR106 TaxID=1403819 RepID=UPI00056E9BD6|nr:hypothetical protein [Verrucomicrobium sp. BvORR106]
MTTPVSDSAKRDIPISTHPSPHEVEDPRETQEVLWEQMRVRTESAPGGWRDLSPEQRISRDGFKPLVTRTISPDSASISTSKVETEAALKAAERYHEELKDESARAEDMLQHLDDLEGHLHALHASNDTSEELSILISYVRLEKALVQGQGQLVTDIDPERQSIPVLSATASVDITRTAPLAKSQPSSDDDNSSDDPKDGPEGNEEPLRVKSAMEKK